MRGFSAYISSTKFLFYSGHRGRVSAWKKNSVISFIKLYFLFLLPTLWVIQLGQKIQNGRLKKNWYFQNRKFSIFFTKISGIGPWVSRIFFFSFISKKIIKIYRAEWIWLNFDDYSGFKPKIIHPNIFGPGILHSRLKSLVFSECSKKTMEA